MNAVEYDMYYLHTAPPPPNNIHNLYTQDWWECSDCRPPRDVILSIHSLHVILNIIFFVRSDSTSDLFMNT